MFVRIDGEAAEWVRFEGEVLELLSARAFAPGTPVSLQVDDVVVRAKVLRSQLLDETFRVRLRVINLKRVHRERFESL